MFRVWAGTHCLVCLLFIFIERTYATINLRFYEQTRTSTRILIVSLSLGWLYALLHTILVFFCKFYSLFYGNFDSSFVRQRASYSKLA